MKPMHPWMLLAPLGILLAATVEGVLLQRTRGHYDWNAYWASAGDLGLRIGAGLLPLGLAAGALGHLWNYRFYTMPLNQPWTWMVLFVGQDFCYYWMHRADHRVRWMWATHSVHHSPSELNLSAAYRLGFTSRLSISPIFFAPLVFMGFPPLVVGGALAANLLYQFWLHAPWIPRLAGLEWVLNTPAHHRVHHASNPEYLDANFGGVLIVFDRMFGTLREELEGVTIRYGLVDPIKGYNPLRVGLHEWWAMAKDVVDARGVRQALLSLFGPPRPHTPVALAAANLNPPHSMGEGSGAP
jgi:sterol desaturase/sphingolipid hydroxylase (fatty acid hydroxylase superfamily)